MIPFTVTSNLARLMCRASFVGCNQHASSNTVPSFSKRTPNAIELVSTHTFISSPLTHHSPWAGSSCVALSVLSAIIWVRRASLAWSSHPEVTAFALCFITPTAMWSQPHTGRCPQVFCTGKKNSPPCENFRNACNHTSPFPSLGAFFPADVQAQYSRSIFKPLWILAIHKLCQFHLDVRCWADIFVDVNGIEVHWCRLFDHLLGQHSAQPGGKLYGHSGPSVWPLQLAPPVLLHLWLWPVCAQVIAQSALLRCLWTPSIVVSPKLGVQPWMHIQKSVQVILQTELPDSLVPPLISN